MYTKLQKLYTQWETGLHVLQKKLQDFVWPTPLAVAVEQPWREVTEITPALFTEAAVTSPLEPIGLILMGPFPLLARYPQEPQGQKDPTAASFGSLRSQCSLL